MADFDETSRSCENNKVEISAYERIKVIFFMTETFHIMELTKIQSLPNVRVRRWYKVFCLLGCDLWNKIANTLVYVEYPRGMFWTCGYADIHRHTLSYVGGSQKFCASTKSTTYTEVWIIRSEYTRGTTARSTHITHQGFSSLYNRVRKTDSDSFPQKKFELVKIVLGHYFRYQKFNSSLWYLLNATHFFPKLTKNDANVSQLAWTPTHSQWAEEKPCTTSVLTKSLSWTWFVRNIWFWRFDSFIFMVRLCNV